MTTADKYGFQAAIQELKTVAGPGAYDADFVTERKGHANTDFATEVPREHGPPK